MGSRELCAGSAALEPLIPTQSPFLSCCQAPGALQDELCAPWWPCAGPGALPFLPDPSAHCRAGTFPVPPLPLAASAHYEFIS